MDNFSPTSNAGLDALSASALAPAFWRPARVGLASAWWEHVPFGQWLVATLRPRTLVELGTHNGVSYSAFCETVLRAGLDTRCSAIDTWQGDEHAGQYDEKVFAELKTFHDLRYGSFSTLIRSTFDDAIQYFPDGSIDLLHIDGLHSYEAVRHDFECWRPKVSQHGVILFHDTIVRERGFGVWKLWEELSAQYPSFSFAHEHGLGVLGIGNSIPEALQAFFTITDAAKINLIREHFALVGERWGLEYRDAVRVDELGKRDRHIQHLENEVRGFKKHLEETVASHHARDHDIASLRVHADALEQARRTLHLAVEQQRDSIEALTRRNDELKAWGEDLLANNQMICTELAQLRRTSEEEELSRIRKKIALQQQEYDALREKVSVLYTRQRNQ